MERECMCAAMSHMRSREELAGKRMYVCCYEPRALRCPICVHRRYS